MSDALEACKAEGLPMVSTHAGQHFGWTTDEDKALRCREIEGVHVMAGYNKTGPRGWEISTATDAEIARRAEALALGAADYEPSF